MFFYISGRGDDSSNQVLFSCLQVDKARIDFGSVHVADEHNDVSDSTARDINIEFETTLIENAAYTNEKALVTAGAEYDSDSYVWIAQAVYNYDMNKKLLRPNNV